jgi:hypothetical protein
MCVERYKQQQKMTSLRGQANWTKMMSPGAGNTKGRSITVPLTSCLTGLESAV